MTTRSAFSPEEWSALHRGATGSAMLVSLIDRDLTDTFGEVNAMSKYLVAQRMAGETELMRDLAHEGGTGFGLTTSPDKLRAETMAALQVALAALNARSPSDLQPYRQFVLGLATAVANAKGGGISAVEASMISEISTALGEAPAGPATADAAGSSSSA